MSGGVSGCARQTSVTAGTVMHGSKLPLTVWFWAAYLMATHSNGIAALQLQKQLGLGSYKSAWLLAAKLRQAMVAPHRTPLAAGRDRRDRDPASHQGRSAGRRARAQRRWQDAGRRRRRSARRRARSAAAGADRRLLRREPARLHQSQRRSRRHRENRRLVQLHRLPALLTTRTPSDRWPRTSSCRRRIVSSPTSRSGRSAPITGCTKSTCNPISTSSLLPFQSRRARHAAFRSLLGVAVALKHVTYNMLIQPEAQA